MELYGRRPLTRLEAGLYGGIAALLIVFLVERMLDYMELAERSAMERTVINVNSGINLRLAQEMLQGRLIDMRGALARNPFALAGMNQPNFLGEQELPSLASLPTRSWVYDLTRRELVYLPRLHRGLRTPENEAVIRFRLTQNPRGAPYLLVPVTEYSWE
jgi:hypothetical protein